MVEWMSPSAISSNISATYSSPHSPSPPLIHSSTITDASLILVDDLVFDHIGLIAANFCIITREYLHEPANFMQDIRVVQKATIMWIVWAIMRSFHSRSNAVRGS